MFPNEVKRRAEKKFIALTAVVCMPLHYDEWYLACECYLVCQTYRLTTAECSVGGYYPYQATKLY